MREIEHNNKMTACLHVETIALYNAMREPMARYELSTLCDRTFTTAFRQGEEA